MKGRPLSYLATKSPHNLNGRHVLLWGYSRQLQSIPGFSRFFLGFSKIFQAISTYISLFSTILIFITGCGSASLKLCIRKAASPWSQRPSEHSQCI